METALGIDFGNSRVGLALGRSGICAPLKIIQAKNWNTVLKDIKKVIEENYISFIVLGIPKQNNQLTRKFYSFLIENLDIKVELWDEGFTSKEALEYAIKIGYSKKGRKHLDNISANMILESYFDSKTKL